MATAGQWQPSRPSPWALLEGLPARSAQRWQTSYGYLPTGQMRWRPPSWHLPSTSSRSRHVCSPRWHECRIASSACCVIWAKWLDEVEPRCTAIHPLWVIKNTITAWPVVGSCSRHGVTSIQEQYGLPQRDRAPRRHGRTIRGAQCKLNRYTRDCWTLGSIRVP